MFESTASKRLKALTTALTAAGIDPDSPDLSAAIAARAPDLAAASASKTASKSEESTGTQAEDSPACYNGDGDPTQDCEGCSFAEDCSNPNKTAKKEGTPSAKEAAALQQIGSTAASVKKWQALAAQAQAANIDLDAIAQDPQGLQNALTKAGQDAVKKLLGQNAPPLMAHSETVQASLGPWQTYQALKEAGKHAEASEYFKAHKTAILSEGIDGPDDSADASMPLTIHSR